ncbi:MAG: hypothetical protein ACFFB3_21685 [Candidatus Hodarchaeota archaeon]
MTEMSRFVRWANRKRKWRGLICHFYIPKSTKQYYSKTDYAYFNLFSDSYTWIVKGTPHHGIKSTRGKRSPIPCLNCFEINPEFYDALKELQAHRDEVSSKFELGIIFNKRKLKNLFGRRHVIDVSTDYISPLPPPRKCHHYDRPRKRVATLFPFNYCDVVRIEIPKSELSDLPIIGMPYDIIMGMLIKEEDFAGINGLLESKDWNEIEVFPLL